MVIDTSIVVTVIASALGGGTAGIMLNKIVMGKKDAADIAQGMAKQLFDQVQTLSLKIEKLENNEHEMRIKIIEFTADNKKLRNEMDIKEKQHTVEKGEWTKKFQQLEVKYNTLQKAYNELKNQS
jgi:ABC-type phosphate transport system auxiliary subunit